MKKITLSVLFAAMAFVFIPQANAQTIIDLTAVDNPNILVDTLPDLTGGEIVLLKPGMVYNAGGHAFDKSVTLQSSEPSNLVRPIIDCASNFNFGDGATVDSIIVRNLEIRGEYDARYFLNSNVSATCEKLMFEGCYIHDLRGILRMKDNGPGTLTNYVISNCVINKIRDYGIVTVDINTWAVNNILIENSTITKTRGFMTSKNNTETLVIDGCTLNEVPKAGERMFRWREAGQDNVTGGITISNTLWGPGWDEDAAGTTAYDGFDGLGTTTWSFSNVYITSDLDIADGKDSIVGVDNVYAGASTDLWANTAEDVLTYADEAFAGIGNAGDQRWGVATDDGGMEINISHPAFNALGTVDTTATVAGLTIHASSAKTVVIDDNGKTVGDMTFTQRLKLGGSGSFADVDEPSARVLELDINHACKIIVAAMSSSSSSDRKMNVCAGSTDVLIDTVAAFGAELTLDTITYTGKPTKMFLYSPSSGVNVYYVKVIDIAGTDATLSALSVDAGDLDPTFDPATESYTCTVPSGTTSVTVTATPEDGNATVAGDGAIDVSSGAGTATVVVTAEDGTTTKTYTIAITVEPAPVTADITFIVDDSQGASYTGFALKGSWNTATGEYDASWSDGAEHTVFYDDGTNGDVTAGDHIWTVTLTLVSDEGANTWEWGFNDDQGTWIPDGNQQFTIPDGTAQTLDAYVIVGIEDDLSNSMRVYPTVSSGMYNVEFAGQPGMIKVYNLSGKLVVSQQATGAVTPVSLEKEGMYMFRLESEEGNRTVRVLTVK